MAFWALLALALVPLAIDLIRPAAVPAVVPATPDCEVVSAYDGDTITALCAGEKLRVRFHCIDAPEMKQAPWGESARDNLRRAVASESVQIVVKDTDRYGRKVAEVWHNGKNVNLAQVESGHAAVYSKYCGDSEYFAAEKRAQSAGLGIWSRPGIHQQPWEFRHAQR
jgi:endonuclease YncB( thermonuclease family)